MLLTWVDLICLIVVLDGLKYASSHEWVKHEGSVATIGITDHAQVFFHSGSSVGTFSFVNIRS